ncbi:acyl-CoA desaturase [Streptomyces sp. LP05-1]|uniref:Acyl-CoA desaturase n=1 Tax=Streptomyces pyxinae TaxID=2970734 RepID=A0ABT2CBX6_9ACTN|nr:acyl-CoA desaturase [Streptomyces sp. LP05-1]MCS0634889.1 acyl-CoA desaturase [Streptomyces sp. LP05-1]
MSRATPAPLAARGRPPVPSGGSTAPPARPPSPRTRPPEDGPRARRPGSEFAPLLRAVREQGLLGRRTGWYAAGITANLLGITALCAALVMSGPSWWSMALAGPLAVLSARAAFHGHDAGHAQIGAGRRGDRAVQLIHANLLLGMSREWWNDKHNRHHANPNHEHKDPDVAPDVLVFAAHQAAGRTGFRGWLTRHQAGLFLPLATLEALALKMYGIRAPLSPAAPFRSRRARVLEGALILAHLVGCATLLLTALTPGQALVFALLHQGLLGLQLSLAFAPNHKGMAVPDPEGEPWGHLRRQVLTSRNIRGGVLTDWFLGGLNHQIEHHLFPGMPRPHLRLARPLVRAHCRSLSLPYTETGLLDSYRQALGHLHTVGEPLRTG